MSAPTDESTEPDPPEPRNGLTCVLAPIAAAPAVAFILMAGIGATLPKDHVASAAAVCEAPPAKAWTVITTFGKQGEWRKEVKQVEQLPDRAGRKVWCEVYAGGDRLTYETLEAEAPKRLVRRIVADGGAISGRWTTTIEPDPKGCKVTITENGTIESPIFRFVSRYFIGHTSTMDLYLGQLQRRLDR